MRPIDELCRDAEKAASEGKDHILISRAELRQLKDYDMVVGTDNPDIAEFGGFGCPLLVVPVSFRLHVRDTLP